MVFTDYVKQHMVLLYNKGYKAPTIVQLLEEDGLTASRQGVHKFLKYYEERRTMARCPGNGHPSEISEEIQSLVKVDERE